MILIIIPNGNIFSVYINIFYRITYTISISTDIHILLRQKIHCRPSSQRRIIHSRTEVVRIQVNQRLAFLAAEEEAVVLGLRQSVALRLGSERIEVVLLYDFPLVVNQCTDASQLVGQGIPYPLRSELHVSHDGTVELTLPVCYFVDEAAGIVVSVLSASVACAELGAVGKVLVACLQHSALLHFVRQI